MLEQGKVRENSGEGSFRYRQANRSLCLEKGAMDKPNHLTAGSFQRFPQDNWSSTASSGDANDWRNREHAVFVLFLNLRSVRSGRLVCTGKTPACVLHTETS